MIKPRLTSLLIAASALSACAAGQNAIETRAPAATSTATTGADCPDVTRLHAAQLHGSWEVELVQAGQRGQLTLRQHPEFSASLRGEFRYGGQRSIASGDVEGGEFNLDESRDGKSLYAFWTGNLVPASCGREITGTWEQVPHAGQPALKSPFVLRRVGGDGSRW